MYEVLKYDLSWAHFSENTFMFLVKNGVVPKLIMDITLETRSRTLRYGNTLFLFGAHLGRKLYRTVREKQAITGIKKQEVLKNLQAADSLSTLHACMH